MRSCNELNIFVKLLALSHFRRRHFPFIATVEDLDMVRAIGAAQAQNRPLTFKLLVLEGLGSVATVQRRLTRMKRLGIVIQVRSPGDRRNLNLTLNAKVCRIYKQLGRQLRESFLQGED